MPASDPRAQLSVRSEKAVLVGVMLPPPHVNTADPRDPLGELASLTKTAGAQVVAQVIQNRPAIHPGTYIGKGKAEEIRDIVKKLDADVVIFDNDMSPNQLRDLEEIIQAKILDRSELILDIFATRARSHESQLQVALAQLEYTYPRLRHMWSHLERIGAGAGAGVGARGPGEMQLEIDRRLVREKVSDLKGRIRDVQARKTREVQERKRQHFTISIVGYTNAGKSTLFNTLTGAHTHVEDKLFATLDTKTRRWHLGGSAHTDDSGGGGAHYALISDTVGFVRDLPHHLVASFKATLEEATHADMLLLVLDVSHPLAQQQLKTVVQTLSDIGCENIPTLLVLNKIDALKQDSEAPDNSLELPAPGRDTLAFWKSVFPDALPASALEGEGIVTLTEVVRDQMLGQTHRARIAVPLADAKGITFIEKFSNVVERDYETAPDAACITTDISQRILDQLANNVPRAKVLKVARLTTAASGKKIRRGASEKAGSGSAPVIWRCRTKPIKELIPEGFLETPSATDAHGQPLENVMGDATTPARPSRRARTGITVGKTRLSPIPPAR